jgi:2-desacetyl-2-hydroxyethyl bacteriochlorophyllide A dehydrogenase
MKAIVVVSPGKVEVREVPMPTPAPFEALVKIEACGLCGTTDRHIVEGHQPFHPADWYPAVLGHESVGTVVEVGAKVTKFKVGDRVTRPVAIWPGTERDGLYSAWGGFAEHGIVRDAAAAGTPEDYTTSRQHVVDPALSLEDAVLALSVSEVASWMEKLSDVKGATIVIGGSGFAAGVMAQCAAAKGAKHVIVAGRSSKKFDWALQNGATEVMLLDDKAGDTLLKIAGAKADWFLDAAGHQEAFEAGLRLLKPGGSIAIYGVPDGLAYRLPLGHVGGDFSVRYLTPTDDAFFPEASRRMISGQLRAKSLRTHVWDGLESISITLEEQAAGNVLKGLIRI